MERESVSIRASEPLTVPGQPFYRLPMGSQEKKRKCKTDQSKRG